MDSGGIYKYLVFKAQVVVFVNTWCLSVRNLCFSEFTNPQFPLYYKNSTKYLTVVQVASNRVI